MDKRVTADRYGSFFPQKIFYRGSHRLTANSSGTTI